MTTGSTDDATDPREGAFVGRRWPVFWMALRMGLFTVLTLGLYRFWMKTRLRRWYWSATRMGGLPLEYAGDPLEKLLGFLIAVVFLAFYIGIVNLVLMFASYSLFQGNAPAYVASLVGVIPLWFYAQYRARRYVLARTRWRGIRFGMLPGAWGYARRALVHWALTLITLGLLWPRMTFWLEKYRTDRTVYGNATFTQQGRWTMLIPATKHIFVGLLLGGGAAVGITVFSGPEIWLGLIAGIGGLWFFWGLVHYRVATTRIMANHKVLGDTQLVSQARTSRVALIYLFGTLAVVLMLALFLFLLGALVVSMVRPDLMAGLHLDELDQLPRWLLGGVGVMAYFALFLMWSAMTHAFITMPVWRHYAATLSLRNVDGLAGITQKDRDPFTEAEGFAEALDVGAAI